MSDRGTSASDQPAITGRVVFDDGTELPLCYAAYEGRRVAGFEVDGIAYAPVRERDRGRGERGGLMEENKPLPCPFCGSEAELLIYYDFYRFSCTNRSCTAHVDDYGRVTHAPGMWFGCIDEARDAWNARAALSPEQFACAVHDGHLWKRADSIALTAEQVRGAILTHSGFDGYTDYQAIADELNGVMGA